MILIDKKDFFEGMNFKDQLPYSQIKILMNSNSQFIVDLSISLNISYSMSSLAIHLTHFFFHKNSYLNHDRYIICAGALFLSCKIFDTKLKIKKICASFYKLKGKLERREVDLIDDKIVNELGEKICSAESDIIKTIDFNLNFEMPYPIMDEICKMYIKDIKEVYYTSRMVMLDVYRSGASLFFSNQTLAFSAVLYALFIRTGDILPPLVRKKYEKKIEEMSKLEAGDPKRMMIEAGSGEVGNGGFSHSAFPLGYSIKGKGFVVEPDRGLMEAESQNKSSEEVRKERILNQWIKEANYKIDLNDVYGNYLVLNLHSEVMHMLMELCSIVKKQEVEVVEEEEVLN